jgi:hypothetical protein
METRCLGPPSETCFDTTYLKTNFGLKKRKLQVLMGQLERIALAHIANTAITDRNYTLARESLEKFFEQVGTLTNAAVKQVFDLQPKSFHPAPTSAT